MLGRRVARGFTLIEMMLTVALIGILAALAWSSLSRQRPRHTLSGFFVELRALVHSARQNAFATGQRTLVLVFPNQGGGGGIGRIVVYQDGDASFFSSDAAVNFEGFAPSSPSAGANGRIVDVVDFPAHVTVGPPAGHGAGAVMAAPFDGIALDRACGFCAGAGPAARGAIAFEPTGAATFYAGNGAPLDLPAGASLSLTADELAEIRTLAVAAPTGALQTLSATL